MKFVQACLSARKHRESAFNHRGEPMKHVEACFLPPRRTCDVRGGLYKYQEGSRKQFSPLRRCCELHAILFKCQDTS